MSFNGSGLFSINTSGQPVVANTLISASVFNAFTADVATGLSTCMTKDGQTTVTANIPMAGFKFTGLGAGSAVGNSLRYEQLFVATAVTLLGPLTVPGLLDISGAAAGQIKFPATQNASADANTIDDYEKGSWTPAIGGTATYTRQAASYTKIGNRVHVTCDLLINAIGSGSDSTISGLPFAAATVGGVAAGGFAVSFISAFSANVTFFGLYPSGTTAILTGSGAAATGSVNPLSRYQNASEITFGGSYGV